MIREYDNHKKRARRRTSRAIMLSAAAAVALYLGAPLFSVASAQTSGAALPDSQTPAIGSIPAPVGHRQPRRQHLPPSVTQDEGDIMAKQRAFDRSIQICRNC